MHLQICTIKNLIQSISTDRCIQSQKQKIVILTNTHQKTRRYPPPRDVAETRKAPAGDYPRLHPPRPSRCCCCCCCCHGARAVIMPLAAMRMFSPRCSTAAVNTRNPRARSLRHYTPRSRVHAIMIHRATFPINPHGGLRTAWRLCVFSRNSYADVFPLAAR